MCVKPQPQVTTMSAVTDKEQLKAICIAFKIYFESTHSDVKMHILTFNSMFIKSENETLSVVAHVYTCIYMHPALVRSFEIHCSIEPMRPTSSLGFV